MKKYLSIIIITLLLPLVTHAVTVFNSNQVGSSPVSGKFLQTDGTVSTWATVTGGSGTYPFTPAINFNVNNQATTGIAWFQNGLNASTTSRFDYASTTKITIIGSSWFPSLASALIKTDANGLTSQYTGTSCTNQFVRALSALGVATCATVSNTDLANSTISGIALGSSLANLTATDVSLTFSGTYNGSTARTVGISAINANSVLGNNSSVSAVPTAIATSSLGIAISDTTGTLLVPRGGTGQITLSSGQLLYGSGTNPIQSVATGTISSSGGISTTAGRSAVGGALAITCDISSASIPGCLSATDWSTFNNKQATIGVTFPITLTGATLGFGGLSTSSASVTGNIPYFSGVNTFANVSTTSVTCTGSTSCSAFTVIGSSPITINSTGGGVYPFTPALNYGATNQATTGIAWYQNGVNASSTSNFVYASTTVITANNGYFTKIGNLVTNGFVKTSNSDGTLSVDTTTYLSTVTADAPLSGSGTAGSHLVLSTAGTWSGNAVTASALSANPANCTAGNYPLGIDASGNVETCTAAATYPFTPAINFNVNNQATTGIAWFQNGLNASTTSRFDYASTTALSGTTICLSTDCRTAWPTAGGGSSGGAWSTTTSTVAGQLINYPNNTTDIVTIGATATTSAKMFFDPNANYSYFNGNVGIGTTSPYAKLSVVGQVVASYFTATSTTATSTFAGAVNISTGSIYQNNQKLLQSSTTALSSLTLGYQAGNALNFSANANTFIGYQSGLIATSSTYNTAVGYQSLYNLNDTVGVGYNTAIGAYSLWSNTLGIYNTAQGTYSLYSNVSGLRNTAQGYQSLYSNTTGLNNTAQGFNSLYNNTTGSYNSSQGVSSLSNNTTGLYNNGQGYQSLYNNTTGSNDIAQGAQSLYSNITGSNNISQGTFSLYYNQSATNTTAIGYNAGRGITNYNNQGGVYVGYQSGYSADISSDYNTLVGYQSGYGITTGARNVFLGNSTIANSYNQVTTGSNNISIGNDVAVANGTASNQLNIGNLIYGTNLDGTGANISSGNIGVGTTSPYAKLSVVGQVVGAYFTATTSTASTFPYASTTALSSGNAWFSGKVGIGTTTPNWLLQLAGTRPFLSLSDTTATTDQKHWTLSSQGGNLYFATSSDALATSTVPTLSLSKNGYISIATSTQAATINIGGNKNATTTEIWGGKWQKDIYDTGGNRVCMFIPSGATAPFVRTGACNL